MPITIDGTGSITGLSVGGLPDASVTQADLAANVVGQGPCFSVARSGNQTLANDTFTKVQFNTEDFDVGGFFDNTTNYRFQPTVAGYYEFSASVSMAGSTTTGRTLLSLRKNGSTVITGGNAPQGNANLSYPSVSGLIFLNGSTDFVEGWAAIQGTGTLNITDGRMSGFLARSA